MATSSTYYLNAATFSLATTLYTDGALTSVAPDGYYSNGAGDVRQQVLGTLGAIAACEGCGTKTPVYGFLYNWFAATDARSIAPIGWHLPSEAETLTLRSYITEPVGGANLKEIGTTHWLAPNSSATNVYGFNARAGGERDNFGAFQSLNERYRLSNSFSLFGFGGTSYIEYSYDNFFSAPGNSIQKEYGSSIRLIKDDSIDAGIMVDQDGNSYPTVTIGTQVWMAADLIVEHYRNGDPIANVTDAIAWSLLAVGAYCAYNNDLNNAYII